MADIERHKLECYERYKERKQRRRQIALAVMAGKERINPRWPVWVQRDIEGEIELIEIEREQERRERRLIEREYMAREARKEEMFDD